jgi:hypothetical protein
MTGCWSEKPSDRYTFAELNDSLEDILIRLAETDYEYDHVEHDKY